MNLRELVAVLGHELRTPLAAILGYQELLADGIYGPLDARQQEPIDRIQFSAHQLLHLIDGLQELVDTDAANGTADSRSTSSDEIETTSCNELLQRIEATAKPYAAGRAVTLISPRDQNRAITGVPLHRFLRAADLALIAAIKSSTGLTLWLDIRDDDHCIELFIHGSALDPAQDDPSEVRVDENTRPLSAARLRLAMAGSTVRAAGGFLRFLPADGSVTLQLRLPRIAS